MAMAPDFNLEILLAYCTRISPLTFLMKYINDAATAVKEAKKDFGRYEHHNKFFFKCCPKWGIRIFFLHCKNGRALVLPVDMTQGREKKNYKHLCLAFVIVFWLNTLHWLA